MARKAGFKSQSESQTERKKPCGVARLLMAWEVGAACAPRQNGLLLLGQGSGGTHFQTDFLGEDVYFGLYSRQTRL